MRFSEVNKIVESMSFHAYKKNPENGYWRPVTGDESRFQDKVYARDFDGDAFDHLNPKYNPDHALGLANANARDVMNTLGYDEEGTIPIDEFIARTTQWLQKNIGKLSPEEPSQTDATPGGMTAVSGGRDEGYMNQIVKKMNAIARDGKKLGATNVGIN